MITLFGATGYTGSLVAHQLANLELPDGNIRLAGRSLKKLEQLSEQLSYQAKLVAADAEDPDTLPALFKDTKVLINCAGPFTDLGSPVVAMAAMHGTHYVDTTNELGFVHSMRGYNKLAVNNQAAIVPACGFEVALADCAAALLAREIKSRLDSIDVIYALSGGNSSQGSRLSAIRSLGTSWLAFRGGEWVRAVPCTRTRWVSLPKGERAALSFPSSETATIPGHLLTDEVNTWLVISRRARHWAKIVLPFFAGMARRPVASWMGAISSWLVKPPQSGLRSQDSWLIQIEAASHSTSRTVTITGKGVYEITAKIAAYAAMKLLEGGLKRFGVLPPSAILDPQTFLQHVIDHWDCQITPPFNKN
jgi:short subunit dehydrogenase-like uncharacterized protein